MESFSNTTENFCMEPYFSNIGASSKDKLVLDSFSPDLILNKNKGIHISDQPPRNMSCSLYSSAIANYEKMLENELKLGKRKSDDSIYMKKIRRNISNKLSAQRCRGEIAQHDLELEQQVELLRDTVAVVTPQVNCQKDLRIKISEENNNLQLEAQKLFKIAQLYEMMLANERFKINNLKELEIAKQRLEVNNLNEFQKVVNNDTQGSNQKSKHFPDVSTKSMVQLYPNLKFYEYRLKHLPMFANPKKLPEVEQNGIGDKPSIFEVKKCDDLMKQNINQDKVDIDEYLNFDAILADLADIMSDD